MIQEYAYTIDEVEKNPSTYSTIKDSLLSKIDAAGHERTVQHSCDFMYRTYNSQHQLLHAFHHTLEECLPRKMTIRKKDRVMTLKAQNNKYNTSNRVAGHSRSSRLLLTQLFCYINYYTREHAPRRHFLQMTSIHPSNEAPLVN